MIVNHIVFIKNLMLNLDLISIKTLKTHSALLRMKGFWRALELTAILWMRFFFGAFLHMSWIYGMECVFNDFFFNLYMLWIYGKNRGKEKKKDAILWMNFSFLTFLCISWIYGRECMFNDFFFWLIYVSNKEVNVMHVVMNNI